MIFKRIMMKSGCELKMTSLDKRKQVPVKLSQADVRRAIKKAEEFKKLLDNGRTKEQIFEDMVKMILGNEE